MTALGGFRKFSPQCGTSSLSPLSPGSQSLLFLEHSNDHEETLESDLTSPEDMTGTPPKLTVLEALLNPFWLATSCRKKGSPQVLNRSEDDELDETHSSAASPPVPTRPRRASKSPRRSSRRRVSFHASVKVVLVATVLEYKNAGLAEDMWWQTSDYGGMKESAMEEITGVMKNQQVPAKDAMKILYHSSA